MKRRLLGVAALAAAVGLMAVKAKAASLRGAFNALAIALPLVLIGVSGAIAQQVCGTPQVSTLWAGQTLNAGTVTVSNDENNLYVTYTTNNGWKLTQAHLYVLDSEPTARLTPGQAPYKAENLSATTYTFTVPLEGVTCGETTMWLQAHAAVVKLDSDGNVIESQTGYGGTVTKPDKGAWYGNIKYIIQCCDQVEGTGCTDKETAWGGVTPGEGNAWWFYYVTATGGAQTVWAGQHINVGNVTVVCNGDASSETCKIMIELTGGWGLVNDDETVKIQGYTTIPNDRPAAGLFTTYKGTDLTVTVPYAPYYAIHLDVGQPAGCDPASGE